MDALVDLAGVWGLRALRLLLPGAAPTLGVELLPEHLGFGLGCRGALTRAHSLGIATAALLLATGGLRGLVELFVFFGLFDFHLGVFVERGQALVE